MVYGITLNNLTLIEPQLHWWATSIRTYQILESRRWDNDFHNVSTCTTSLYQLRRQDANKFGAEMPKSGEKKREKDMHSVNPMCLCVGCVYTFVELVKFSGASPPDYPMYKERQREAFFKRHGIVEIKDAKAKKTSFFHVREPTQKFPSLDHLLYSWYGFIYSVGGSRPATAEKRAPFPPPHVRQTMFADVYASMAMVEAQHELQNRGAMPQPYKIQGWNPSLKCARSWEVRLIPCYITGKMKQSTTRSSVVDGVARIRAAKKVLPNTHHEEIMKAEMTVSDTWRISMVTSVPTSDKWYHVPSLPRDESDLGHNEGTEECATEGSHTNAELHKMFRMSCLNESSVFLDIGSGHGDAMAVASMYRPRLNIGIEFMKARCQSTLRRFVKNQVRALVLHSYIDGITHYTPATHIHLFGKGMCPTSFNLIKRAIQRTPTVQSVTTSNKSVGEIPGFTLTDNEAEMGEAPKKMRHDACSVNMYTYKRDKYVPRPCPIHPILLGPVFMDRLPTECFVQHNTKQMQAMFQANYGMPFFSAVDFSGARPVYKVDALAVAMKRHADEMKDAHADAHAPPGSNTRKKQRGR